MAIVRPVNAYCNGSTCTTPSTLNSNAKARKDLQWLKIEQYTTKTTPTINNLSNCNFFRFFTKVAAS